VWWCTGRLIPHKFKLRFPLMQGKALSSCVFVYRLQQSFQVDLVHCRILDQEKFFSETSPPLFFSAVCHASALPSFQCIFSSGGLCTPDVFSIKLPQLFSASPDLAPPLGLFSPCKALSSQRGLYLKLPRNAVQISKAVLPSPHFLSLLSCRSLFRFLSTRKPFTSISFALRKELLPVSASASSLH